MLSVFGDDYVHQPQAQRLSTPLWIQYVSLWVRPSAPMCPRLVTYGSKVWRQRAVADTVTIFRSNKLFEVSATTHHDCLWSPVVSL